MHLISIMSFKLGHVSISKRLSSPEFEDLKIFTYLLPNCSYKDPRLTEVTYHCISFNDRVRKVPKIKIYIFGTFLILSLKFDNKCVKILKFGRTELSYAQNKNRGKKMLPLGMDACPSLNDIMEIRCNKCTRSEQGYNF